MSARHAESHEMLLERVVTGDLTSSAPEVSARLAECPECRESLARMQSLIGSLTRAGELERETLREGFGADTRRAAPAEHEERIRALVRERIARQRGASVRRLVRVALAAAAGIALVVLLYRRLAPDRPGEVLLGSDRIVCERPVGEADFGTFSWRFDLPSRGRFELRVWDDSSPEEAPPLVQEVDLTESRWTPEPEDVQRWPQRIRWEVRAYDAGDQLLRRSELQRAWRSR